MGKEIIYQLTKEGKKITEEEPSLKPSEKLAIKILKEGARNIKEIGDEMNQDAKELLFSWYKVSVILEDLERLKLVERRK